MVTRQQTIASWLLAKAKLNAAKVIELAWRIHVADENFDDPQLGTNTSDDGLLKLICKENLTIEKDTAKLFAAIRAAAEQCPNEIDLFNGLLVTKYALDRSVFDALSNKARGLLKDVVTISNATPDLKYKGEA